MEHFQCIWTPESSGADAALALGWDTTSRNAFDGLDLTGFDLRNTRFENCTFPMHLGGREDDRRPLARRSVRTLCTLPGLRWSTLDTLVLDFTLVDCRAPDGDWGKWTCKASNSRTPT